MKTPKRISKKGNEHGGRPFSRGNLYKILGNTAYIGKIAHKGKLHDGLHEGILSSEIWEETQTLLKTNGLDREKPSENINVLQGKLFDFEGRPYSPTYTLKAGKQYRYYLSQNLIQYKDHPKGLIARLPAHEIESCVGEALRSRLREILNEAGHKNLHIEHAAHLLDQASYQTLITELVETVSMQADQFQISCKKGSMQKFMKGQMEVNTLGIKDDVITETYASTRIELFNTYLPKRYVANRAHVIDSEGNMSDQLDVVIHDRFYSPIVFRLGEAMVIPAECVYATFDSKQELSSATMKAAGAKAKSVRGLKRTSLPIPTANGPAPAKPPFRIICGVLAVCSVWTPALGDSFKQYLGTATDGDLLDIICVANEGLSYVDTSGNFRVVETDRAVTKFILELIAQLQSLGTVGMIETRAYAAALD